VTGTRKTPPPWNSALKRAALYFLGLDLLAFFYYALGNYQEFLAGTQLMLLHLVSVLSTAAVLSGLAGLVHALVRQARVGKKASLLGLVGWVACMAAGLALALLSHSVRAFASGI